MRSYRIVSIDESVNMSARDVTKDADIQQCADISALQGDETRRDVTAYKRPLGVDAGTHAL